MHSERNGPLAWSGGRTHNEDRHAMPAPFRDRVDAGCRLAARLTRYSDRDNTLVLALPRGGVPVAFEVARALRAPLDVFVVRKLGVPGHEELAMGAIAGDGIIILNDEVLRSMGIPSGEVERVIRHEGEELARREREYRGERAAREIRGRIAIVVDGRAGYGIVHARGHPCAARAKAGTPGGGGTGSAAGYLR